MGCFDATCPLSGIAIHDGDPIRWGLITHTHVTQCITPERDFKIQHDPCDKFCFITPLLKGKYNDYGMPRWDEDIASNPTFQLIWKHLRDNLQPTPDYIQNHPEFAKKKPDDENLFDNTVWRRYWHYDPDHHLAHDAWKSLPKYIGLWYTHEAVYQHFVKHGKSLTEYTASLAQQIDNFFSPVLELNGHPIPKDVRSILAEDNGLPGAFWRQFDTMLNIPLLSPEEVKRLKAEMLETVQFTSSLWTARRVILPMWNNGEQYDDYKGQVAFEKVVLKLAQAKRAKNLRE